MSETGRLSYRAAAETLRQWFQSIEAVEVTRLQDAVTVAIEALEEGAERHAWDEDKRDMQQIEREWSDYDRDPPGS